MQESTLVLKLEEELVGSFPVTNMLSNIYWRDNNLVSSTSLSVVILNTDLMHFLLLS